MRTICSTFVLASTGLFVAVCILVNMPQALRAEALHKVPPVVGQKPNKVQPPVYLWSDHTKWTTEAWTSNDKPYQIIRSQIDNALAKSPQMDRVLLAKYAADHKAHPASPTALFRWAFTSLKLAPQSLVLGDDGLDGVRDAFAKTPFPRTYNYARLGYLLYQHAFALPNFTKIGERLLKQQPVDFPVQYYYINSLTASSNLSDIQAALAETQKLIRQQPNKISLYALEGSVYHRLWGYDVIMKLPKKANADLCIAAYQEYLNRSPANDPFRKNAEDMIDLVKTR